MSGEAHFLKSRQSSLAQKMRVARALKIQWSHRQNLERLQTITAPNGQIRKRRKVQLGDLQSRSRLDGRLGSPGWIHFWPKSIDPPDRNRLEIYFTGCKSWKRFLDEFSKNRSDLKPRNIANYL